MFLYLNILKTTIDCYYLISVEDLLKLDEAVLYDPAICPNQCGRKYRGKRRKSHLKVHMKYECGVPRQFRCEYCQKNFVHKAHLKVHLGVIHGVLL